MDDLSALDRLLIQQACQQQINRFAALNDAGDYRALADLFVEHGSFARPSQPDTPIVGREAIFTAFCARPPRTSVHIVSNVLVEVLSATAASAHSRILLFAAPPGEIQAQSPLLIGSFSDQLVLDAGHWRFASRQGRIELRFD